MGQPLVLRPEGMRFSARSIRVLIDGRKIRDGGIGVYIDNLIRGLLRTSFVELSVIVRERSHLPADLISSVQLLEVPCRGYSLKELTFLHRVINQQSVDIFHEPHFTLPLFIRHPCIVTVHDLIQIRHPERAYYPAIAGAWLRSAVRRASGVVTVSEGTRHDLMEFLGRDADRARKIVTIPNALPPMFTVLPLPSFREPFAIAVCSTLKPHKGLRDLMTAFALARQHPDFPKELKLIIVGQGLVREEAAFRRLRDSLRKNPGLNTSVEFRGEQTPAELLALYRKAQAVVVASTVEGFAFPMLEAQSQGAPVISRPTPVAHELATSADWIAPDMSVNSLGETLVAALSAPPRMLPSAERERHIRQFSLPKVAAATLALYRSVAQAEGEL